MVRKISVPSEGQAGRIRRGVRTAGLLTALAAAALVASPAQAREDEVVIGVAAPLTGDQAYIGLGVMRGAQLAVDEANVKGPAFGTTRFRLEALDDQHNPTQAVLAANKFVANPDVAGVVGHFNSSCSKAASAIYHEARLAQVSPGSTNPEISRQGYDTFFRVCATDDVQSVAAATFVFQKLGLRRIAIVDDQTTYGKGLADQFRAEFERLGGEVLRRDGITQGEKDFTPLLTKIRAVKPELVFFGGVYPEMSLLLKQSRKVGLKAPWMGGDGIFEPSLVELASPAIAEGTYATMLGVDPKLLPGARDFVARYEARFGAVGSFSAYAYDAANVLIEAVRQAGVKDRTAVLDRLRRIESFEGVFGPIRFDARGDAVGKGIGIYRIQNGKFHFLEEVRPEPAA